MKRPKTDPETLLALFVLWCKRVGNTFPPLWEAAKAFAPLVVDFCDQCEKPKAVTFVPVGDHAVCKSLGHGHHDTPLPPFI